MRRILYEVILISVVKFTIDLSAVKWRCSRRQTLLHAAIAAEVRRLTLLIITRKLNAHTEFLTRTVTLSSSGELPFCAAKLRINSAQESRGQRQIANSRITVTTNEKITTSPVISYAS